MKGIIYTNKPIRISKVIASGLEALLIPVEGQTEAQVRNPIMDADLSGMDVFLYLTEEHLEEDIFKIPCMEDVTLLVDTEVPDKAMGHLERNQIFCLKGLISELQFKTIKVSRTIPIVFDDNIWDGERFDVQPIREMIKKSGEKKSLDIVKIDMSQYKNPFIGVKEIKRLVLNVDNMQGLKNMRRLYFDWSIQAPLVKLCHIYLGEMLMRKDEERVKEFLMKDNSITGTLSGMKKKFLSSILNGEKFERGSWMAPYSDIPHMAMYDEKIGAELADRFYVMTAEDSIS